MVIKKIYFKKISFYIILIICLLQIPVKIKSQIIEHFKTSKNNFLIDTNSLHTYRKIKFKPKNLQISIPVSFSSIENELRDYQLLNNKIVNNSFNIRPIYINLNILNDTNNIIFDKSEFDFKKITEKKFFQISLLPVNLIQKYTSDHPYGFNDGSLILANGYQTLISSGINLNSNYLEINIQPEFLYAQNKQFLTFKYPEIRKYNFGNSYIFLKLKKFNIGIANQNMWWGPSIYNSLLMTNNAPGFLNAQISTSSPVKTFFGNFEMQIIFGNLTRDTLQGLESNGMNRPDPLNPYFNYVKNPNDFNIRNFNAINLSFSPKFAPTLFFGISRIFQNYAREAVLNNFIQNYLPVFNSFFKKNYEDEINRDQYLSANFRWIFPKNNAEFYLETGFNDAFLNIRDFILDIEHASALTFGLKKLFPYSELKYVGLNLEITRLAQTPSYIHRQASNWYRHSQILEGYTNENQVMGAGSGLGNNIQTISLTHNSKKYILGLTFRHIAQDPIGIVDSKNLNNGLRDFKWNDFSYSFYIKRKINKFVIRNNFDIIKNVNYNWIENDNRINFVNNLSISYLW